MTSMQIARRLGSAGQRHGLLRFEPARDLKAVVELLRLGFEGELDEQERMWLEDLQWMASFGPLLSLLRLVPSLNNSFGGFVWYESGRLVANASLMRGRSGVAVIANVVTHPDFRRRGIARSLTEACIESARSRSALRIELQVHRDNEPAKRLYEELGFQYIYGYTTYRIESAAEAARLARAVGGVEIAPWRGAGGAEARRLLARVGRRRSEPMPGPLAEALQHRSLIHRIEDRLAGHNRIGWAAIEGGAYRALLAAMSRLDGTHRLEIVTEPAWRGRVEAQLVDAAMVEFSRKPAPVEARVRNEETGARSALASAGFEYVRTLDRFTLQFD